MNVGFVDEALLRSLTATLLAAFGEVRLYRPDPDTLVFLASAQPLNVEAQVAASGRPLVDAPAHYARSGIRSVEDLFVALAVDGDGARALAAGAALITDDNNRMAMASLQISGKGLDPQRLGHLLAAYDPLQKPGSWVFRSFRDTLSFSYIARRMAAFKSIDASISERIAAMNRILQSSGAVINAGLRASTQDAGTAPLVEHADDLARASNWKALSELDAPLAQVSWTDDSKPEAVRLRAEWRSHASSLALRQKAGEECISIIDDALVTLPSLRLYALRARCGLLAARNDVVVESLWRLGDGTYLRALDEPGKQREAARDELQTLVMALEKDLPVSSAFDRARRDEVEEKLRAHVGRLQ
jgi:hypothetical protein